MYKNTHRSLIARLSVQTCTILSIIFDTERKLKRNLLGQVDSPWSCNHFSRKSECWTFSAVDVNIGIEQLGLKPKIDHWSAPSANSWIDQVHLEWNDISDYLLLWFSYIEYEQQLFANVAEKHRCGRPNQQFNGFSSPIFTFLFFQSLDSVVGLVSWQVLGLVIYLTRDQLSEGAYSVFVFFFLLCFFFSFFFFQTEVIFYRIYGTENNINVSVM